MKDICTFNIQVQEKIIIVMNGNVITVMQLFVKENEGLKDAGIES